MDIIGAIITGTVLIAIAIFGGFERLRRKLNDVTHAIARLEAKLEVLDSRLHSHEKQIDGLDSRMGQLDRRLNGVLDHMLEAKEGT